MSRAFSSTTELLKRRVAFHGSGAIGRKNLKRDNRETSLHIYPNGVVKPTNEKWPTLQVTAATAEELGEDAVWLDPDYCESYALGGSNAAVTSEDKHGEGKDKEKGKDKVSEVAEDSLSSGGGSSGWQWDIEMQMNKRWANDLESLEMG
ncbi:uncharacterized protein RSE6_03429 [Rhynchosporium secalis]|uniref:Uncharacterized protein n=1 Tax=Rhynchosporium secalis TaxID=38038 RepID=A0A1E1M2R8_RHYSE|nr:uncharacterized protein RSE6_03429 [Rhynchosporium secalis]